MRTRRVAPPLLALSLFADVASAQIAPPPRALEPRPGGFTLPAHVALVAAARADPFAVATVADALRAAGCARVDRVDDAARIPAAAGAVVYLGAHAASRAALELLGAQDA